MTAPGQTIGYYKAAQPTAANVKAKPTGSGTGKAAGASSGRRGVRHVRTAAGAKRYGVPIGAEIGRARNAAGAQAQRNKPAQDRYKALVGRDPKTQAAALHGLNSTQLTRLTKLAWSFKTKDPNVTRLRTGLTRELAHRGINIRTYLRDAGIRTQAETNVAERRVRARSAPKKKPTPKPKPGGRGRGSSGAAAPVHAPRPPSSPAIKHGKAKKARPASAMSARKNDRRLLSLSNVGQLRAVQTAFAKVAPQHRERAAQFIVRQAVELSAVHMLSRSVVEASNITAGSALGQRVIELAGRWKHGYIPLDATAMASKMKGGHGKPWWEGGKTKRRGNKASLRRSIDAGNKNRGGRGKITVQRTEHKGGPVVPGTKQTVPARKTPFVEKTAGPNTPQPAFTRSTKYDDTPAGKAHLAKHHTTVVKSGGKPTATRGAKVTAAKKNPELDALAAKLDKVKIGQEDPRGQARAYLRIKAKLDANSGDRKRLTVSERQMLNQIEQRLKQA